jgi:hypothetical protein
VDDSITSQAAPSQEDEYGTEENMSAGDDASPGGISGTEEVVQTKTKMSAASSKTRKMD